MSRFAICTFLINVRFYFAASLVEGRRSINFNLFALKRYDVLFRFRPSCHELT